MKSSSPDAKSLVTVQSYPEPTCYSVLALALASDPSAMPSAIERGLRWLASRVNSQGALTLEGDDEPHWSTSLFVLTLARLNKENDEFRMRNDELKTDSTVHHSSFIVHRSGIEWLLSWEGNRSELQEGIFLNSQLRGWPWISDTFSWVEPTSYAVLALKLSGHGDHPRVAEAQQLLLDRVCAGGGWNYGNRLVFNRELVPFLPTTALAALALQGAPAATPMVDQGVRILRREVSQHPSTLALALAILCFNAFDQPTDELVTALLKRQRTDGSWRQATHLTALAVLALTCVTGGPNVFKL